MSKKSGLDAANRIAEIVLGRDFVPVEYDMHITTDSEAEPARPGDEAAAQVVEPDPVEACRIAKEILTQALSLRLPWRLHSSETSLVIADERVRERLNLR